MFLDDWRPCPEGFVLAKNAEECILLLDEEEIGICSLDYDLGWGQSTGLAVAEHIVHTQRFPQHIYLHTSSPSGRMQMYQLLAAHLPHGVKLYQHAMPK